MKIYPSLRVMSRGLEMEGMGRTESLQLIVGTGAPPVFWPKNTASSLQALSWAKIEVLRNENENHWEDSDLF